MSTLKILAVVAAVFGLLGIGTVVRQTATNADHCQACNDSDCQFCLDDAACDEGACASGECSGQCDASTAFAFEHEAPACSACAHEASTAPDGEVVPGDVTETGELASETSERSIVTVTDATFANYVNAETGNRVLSGRVLGTEALGVACELMRILRSNTGGWHTVRERHVHERLGDRAWNGS